MASSLVKKLTTDDTSVISAYSMKELSDMTFKSYAECESIRELLLYRLDRPSPDVKYKTLRIIKYVAQNGRSDFRISFQRKATPIKQCQAFRAPPDPLRGDVPSERVREAAREALEAIFNENNAGPTSSGQVSSDRIQGFGGGAVLHPSAYPPSAPSNEFSLSTASVSDILTTVKNKVSTTVSELKGESAPARHGFSNGVFSGGANSVGSSSVSNSGSNMSYTPATKSKYGGMGSDGSFHQGAQSGSITSSTSSSVPYDSYNTSASTYNSHAVSTGSTVSSGSRFKGAVGGGWGDDTSAPTLGTSKPVTASAHSGFGLGPSSAVSPTSTISKPVASQMNTREPGPYETKLIDDLTAPTGIRSGLTPQEKSLFISKCASLDNHAVSICLERKLSPTTPLVSTIKALFLLESLLSSGSDDADDYFNDNQQSLISLEQSPNKTVQALATKCLVQLGIRDKGILNAPTSSTPTAITPAIAPASFDIFGGLNVSQSTPSTISSTPVTAAANAPSATSDLTDLFGSLNINPAATIVAASNPSFEEPSSFDFLANDSVSSSSTATISSSSGFDDLFGNLNNSSTTSNTNSSVSAFDSLLSGSSIPTSAPYNGHTASKSSQTNVFGGYDSMNTSDDVFANISSAPASQYNFDFMNSTATTSSSSASKSSDDPFAFINDM